MRVLRLWITLVLLAALGLPVAGSWRASPANAVADTAGDIDAGDADTVAADLVETQVARLLASYTPEERIGQLMLVTFEGTSLRPDTTIARLIAEYNIGGVILLASNDNINGQINTPRLVQALTTDLQQLAYDAAEATSLARAEPRPYTPLLIATQHAGDGLPNTQIAQGTTPLPSLMALGATWNPAYARQVGEVAGIELSAMGINLLLGPALDVAQQPQSGRALDLGVNTLGGSPYWVGRLGAAYVEGVHAGSTGRVGVIAQHFPGLGFADTDPDLEIPVVPRTISELSQFDLVPFAAVADLAGSPLARADGFQCANLRYQGANIRATTNPLCIDPSTLESLLTLDSFDSWRADGIVISPPLGSAAIRRHYPAPFNPRQVAREAFWAGNDMLYLAEFGLDPTDDPYDTIASVIRYFAERYEADPVFRSRIDQSLGRILRLKLRLYDGDLSLPNVMSPVNDISTVGTFTSTLYPIAQRSVTLIAPRRESLQAPPGRNDHIVIFTDVRLVQQCSFCAAYPLVMVNALEKAIEEIYGPYGGAQIAPDQVVSFSLAQLQAYLSGDENVSSEDGGQIKTNQRIAEALREMDWLVLVVLDLRPDQPATPVIRYLLSSQSAVLARSKLAVIVLGAPVSLSSTEISKFDAYVALYSHWPPAIDTAVRALFQETDYPGAPPISLPAIGYNLTTVTAPDPGQMLRLTIESFGGRPPSVAISQAEVIPMRVGQQITLKTAPILDANGHIVPDNTAVEFTLAFVTDSAQNRQVSLTKDGVALTTFTPTRVGRVQITAASGEARRSNTVQIVVTEESVPLTAADAGLLTGTPDAADPGSPSGASPASTESPPAVLLPTSVTISMSPQRRLDALDLALSLFGLTLLGAWGFFVGRAVTLTPSGGVRLVLSCVVAGLIGYIYYGLGGPGAALLYDQLARLTPLALTLGMGLIGLAAAWWALRHTQR